MSFIHSFCQRQIGGYTSDDAGTFGALIIGCGLLGAAIVGPIMDKTHAYNPILKIGITASTLSVLFFILVLRPNGMALLCVGFGIMGFCMMPLLPVAFECGVECSYPISEETSSGLMMLVAQWFGIGLIYGLDALIDKNEIYSTVWIGSSFLLLGAMILATICAALYKGPYKRLHADHGSHHGQPQPQLGNAHTQHHHREVVPVV
jgi:hypothetical protein